MNLCILSAAPKSSSSGFATSVAAILGILARRPTLLVDLGNSPQQTRKALGIDDAEGTETLVDQYIRTHALTADVRQQIVSYVISTETNLAGRGFDCLAGPVKYSPQYEDRLAAQRGVEFADLLVDKLAELAYEYVVVDIGNTLDTLRGITLANRASFLSWSMKTKHYSKSGQEAKRSSNAWEKCKSQLANQERKSLFLMNTLWPRWSAQATTMKLPRLDSPWSGLRYCVLRLRRN